MDTWARLAGVAAAAVAFAGVMTLTAGDDAPERGAGSPMPRTEAARAATAREGLGVFARFGCGSCHALEAAGARGKVGPNLDDALGPYDRDALIAAIVDPYPGRSSDVMPMMPEDFGKRMSEGELDALVTFLLAADG